MKTVELMLEPFIEPEFEQLSRLVQTLAEIHRDDTHELVALLRLLEKLHREVRQHYFEPALPNTRQDLYLLLKEIEEQGGWPYIERMKLQCILAVLQSKEEVSDSPEAFP